MKVHVFGNSPSPAVAIYCLRRAIRQGAQVHEADTVYFVERNFYVDDSLHSVRTDAEAIDLLRKMQTSLDESNLRLHMFASKSADVLEAFAPEDCAEVMKDVDVEKVDGENRKFNDWTMSTIYECILMSAFCEGPIHQHTLHFPQNRRIPQVT